MLRYVLFVICLTLFSPYSFANNEVENPKYEGIDITVNVNQASAEELADLLSGVGQKKAQAIVDYRQEHGEFTSVDELVNVKGVGPALLEKNRNRIQL